MGHHFQFLYLSLFLHWVVNCFPVHINSCGKPALSSVERRPIIRTDIEVYEPINLHLNSPASLNENLPELNLDPQLCQPSSSIDEFRSILDMSNTFSKTSTDVKALDQRLRSLAFKIEKSNGEFPEQFNASVFMRRREFQFARERAVRILQNLSLEPRETVWVLAVLKHLQGYLPQGDLEPIRTDMARGPICRAALGLHLTKDLNLLNASKILWSSPAAPELVNVDQSLAEAYFALRTIDSMRSYVETPNESEFFTNCAEVYNYLLNTKIPIEEKGVDFLTKKFIALSTIENRGIAFSHLYHMQLVFPRVKHIIDVEKSKDTSFKEAYENEELVINIRRFVVAHSRTPISNLIYPFLNFKVATVQNVKDVVDAMLEGKREEERASSGDHRRLSVLSQWVSKEEGFLIRLLNHIGSHIPGAKQYLDSQVEWSGKLQSHLQILVQT
ncbi:hypothetical protein DFH28DRAFT_981237 [Melampsora americana]|nr:hypothetical protein DFH28DRAFT_981237 [Melampsora americana]